MLTTPPTYLWPIIWEEQSTLSINTNNHICGGEWGIQMVPGAWRWEAGMADLCLESAIKGEYCTLAFCIANDQPCAVNGYSTATWQIVQSCLYLAVRPTSSLAFNLLGLRDTQTNTAVSDGEKGPCPLWGPNWCDNAHPWLAQTPAQLGC